MKHLFIDDYEVESIHNLARKLHQPEKFHANAVVRPEYRWENQMIRMGGSVTWDPEDQLFKLIYRGTAAAPISTVGSAEALKLHPAGDAGAVRNFSCYATSSDGVNWEKPFLGLYDYEELTWNGKRIGTENNILPSIKGVLRGPIYDPAESDPRRRFKALSYRSGGLYTQVSADCIHWQELDLPPQPSADVSELYLDETRNLFISTAKHRGPYGRSFFLSTSEDFHNWSEQELIFHADQTDQENGFARLRKFFDDAAYLTPVYNRPEEWRTDIYHFPVFRYEDLYLAMPVMHHWAGKHPPLYENVDSRKSVELASSRDLRHWERVASRAPFLELSPVGDGGRYDTGQIAITNGVVRRNNQLWFYYGGSRHRGLSIADQLCQGYLNSSAVCMARTASGRLRFPQRRYRVGLGADQSGGRRGQGAAPQRGLVARPGKGGGAGPGGAPAAGGLQRRGEHRGDRRQHRCGGALEREAGSGGTGGPHGLLALQHSARRTLCLLVPQ